MCQWRTPLAQDAKHTGRAPSGPGQADKLAYQVIREDNPPPDHSLNPDWVEALMGFPPGWTVGPPAPAKRSTRGNRRAPRPDPPPTETDG